MSRAARRAAIAGGSLMLLGVAAGVFVGTRLRKPAADELRKTMLYAPLVETSSAMRPTQDRMEPPGLDAGPQRYLAWTESHYDGKLTRDAVETILRNGHAQALECHLARDATERLGEFLASLNRALTEVSETAQAEVADVKRRLLTRPDRFITIRTQPREKDAAYGSLQHARDDVESAGLGAVWGDYVNGQEIHFVVRWDEHPVLKSLYDERVALLLQRRDRVRHWIEQESHGVGMSLFQSP